MANHQPLSFSPRSVCQLMVRHKKKVLFCPVAAVALGVLVLLYFPRSYESEAQIFLRLGRESLGIDPTATTGQMISLHQGDRKDEVKSAIEVIKSRGIAAQAVDAVGPAVVLGRDAKPQNRGQFMESLRVPVEKLIAWVKSIDPISDREAAIVEVQRHLQADAERGSTLIVVSYEADTPQLAQAVCNAVVEIYQHEHMRIHRSAQSRPFFEEQGERLRQQLDEALFAVQNAKNEMGLASVEERRATLEAQFSAVELERLTTEQQLATSVARIADLDQQLAKVPERLVASKKSIPNVGTDLLRDKFYELQVKAMDLGARYSESHPLVQTVNAQLKDAKEVLATQTDERMETTDNVNPIHRDLSLERKREQSLRAGHEARLAELGEQKQNVQSALRSINESEITIDQLQRHADLARGKYFQYAQNMEEARIDQALENNEISNLSEVLPATLAERPVSPSKLLVAAATLLLATAGTAALVLGSELSNEASRTPTDLEAVLGESPPGATPNGRVRRREYANKARDLQQVVRDRSDRVPK